MRVENEIINAGMKTSKPSNKTKVDSFSDILTNGMSEKKELGDNKLEGGGWAYVDKYGFSHVVADFKTAQEFKMSATKVFQYNGKYGGGYALGEDNERMRVGLEKEVPYANDLDSDEKASFVDKKFIGLDINPYKYLKILETQDEFLSKKAR